MLVFLLLKLSRVEMYPLLTHSLSRGTHREFATRLKTKSAVKKRFFLRKSGGIKCWSEGARHNTGYKSRSRNNRLAKSCGIKEKKIEKNIRKMLFR